MEIYVALDGNGCVSVGGELLKGKVVVIGPGTIHAITDIGKSGIVIFIDPLSPDIGFSLRNNLLKDKTFTVINDVEITDIISVLKDDETEQTVHLASETIIQRLNKNIVARSFSGAVMEAISIISKERESFNMETLVITNEVDKTGKKIRKQREIDFICNKGSKRYYIQSALALPDDAKKEQEQRSLLLTRDGFKKIIITKDAIAPLYNEDGVLVMGLFDFLLNEDSLDQ